MADRDASGKWLKGTKSPNPGGRPREVSDVRELAKAHSAEAISTLAEIMRDRDAPPAARTAAATALLDRAFGKPPASMEGRVEVRHSIADTAASVLQALTQRAKERQAEQARVIDGEVLAIPTRQ